MIRKPVNSSNIKEIGWENGVLEVQFNKGTVYQYFKVPENVFNDLMKASSIGGFFYKFIAKGYEYKALDDFVPGKEEGANERKDKKV